MKGLQRCSFLSSSDLLPCGLHITQYILHLHHHHHCKIEIFILLFPCTIPSSECTSIAVHAGGIRDFCNYSKNHFLVKIDSIIVIYVQFYVHRHIPIYSYNCITSFKIVNRLRQICQKKVSGHLSFCR